MLIKSAFPALRWDGTVILIYVAVCIVCCVKWHINNQSYRLSRCGERLLEECKALSPVDECTFGTEEMKSDWCASFSWDGSVPQNLGAAWDVMIGLVDVFPVCSMGDASVTMTGASALLSEVFGVIECEPSFCPCCVGLSKNRAIAVFEVVSCETVVSLIGLSMKSSSAPRCFWITCESSISSNGSLMLHPKQTSQQLRQAKDILKLWTSNIERKSFITASC